ncbi:hypothetical protein FB45DRAFT_459436 [Roridomyces roridus]|uniref:Uncharacterized protein n=1 Tax=Roridomyces roridus TaxID=1738132 RepID=A0AAD7B0G7_9AGAR|nr:hypothetical protein FB45DRAFT_459436 [Roridomyces roridus]
MRRDIPDEIFHEIFSPALLIPDETFSSHRYASAPAETLDEPSSTILLACKTWLRIATPLLYKVVILSSRGQTQALEFALHSNPELGRLIKKLRIQGRYGMAIYEILQVAKTLTDICVSLEFDAEESGAEGLCRGLPLISPIRLILAYRPTQFDIEIDADAPKLVEAMVECIPKWQNLAVVEMPHDSPHSEANYNEMIAAPLKDANNLRSLVLSAYEKHLFANGTVPEYISTIASNPCLKEVRPKGLLRQPLSAEFGQVVQSNARLAELFNLRHFGISPKPFVYPPQLAAHPKLEDVIWDRVLSHLFPIIDPERDYSDEDDDDADIEEPPAASSYLLICKRFERPGTPYLYENPYLQSDRGLRTFSQRLADQPSLGLHVRRLRVEIEDDYPDIDTLEEIIARVPGVVEFNAYGCAWPLRMIVSLAVHCGTSLQIFRAPIVVGFGEMIDPSIFAQFPRLQSLTWECHDAFNLAEVANVTNAFGQLRDLLIEAAHPSFHDVLAQMQLPSLRTANLISDTGMTLNNPFFQKHGKKLEELTLSPIQISSDSDIFRLCPSIKALTIACIWAEDMSSKLREPHRSIERIVISSIGYREETETQLLKFLTSFDPELFPALREIQHPDCDWTSVDEPPSSALVQWANELAARNIHLVNKKGGRWRPRRQYVDEE